MFLQIFPRDFTTVAIKGFFRKRKDSIAFRCREHEGRTVKLSLMKDGRASLTNGLRDMAETDKLDDGTPVAFSFGEVGGVIDMQSVALTRGG
jgi:hypothetical protein